MVVRFYMVDRISAREAVLVDDHGRAISVPLSAFHHGIAENMVLRVPADDGSAPDWASATVDPDETDRRARQAQAMLEQIRRQDPDA